MVLATLVHMILVPASIQWLETWTLAEAPPPQETRMQRPKPPSREDAVKLGKERPQTSSLAWIDYEDFRDLIAPKSQTLQPAVQQELDPVLEAPTPPQPGSQTPPQPDPTPNQDDPSPSKRTPPPAQAPDANPSPATTPSPEKPASSSPQTIDSGLDGSLAVAPSAHSTAELLPPTTSVDGPVSPDTTPPPSTAPSPQTSQAPPNAQKKPTPPPTPNPQRPAVAPPRADKDSDPFGQSDTPIEMQLGGVLAGPGIEIKPARPRFDIVSLVSAVPDNPVARITFDLTGQVTEVKLLRSTGYADLDGPIEASLYKWKASGPRLKKLEQPLSIEFHIILFK